MVFRLESLLKGYKFFYQFEEPTIAALLASSSSSVIVPESKSFWRTMNMDTSTSTCISSLSVALKVFLLKNRGCDRGKLWTDVLNFILTWLSQKDLKNQKKTHFSSAKSIRNAKREPHFITSATVAPLFNISARLAPLAHQPNKSTHTRRGYEWSSDNRVNKK